MSIFRSLLRSHLFWLILGVGCVGFGAVVTGTVSLNETAPPPAVDEAPSFTLDTLDDTRLRLRDLRGEVVILNFWATWCPPCRREIPDFVRLQREFGDEGLQFVGVALERSAGPDKVRAFADRMDINYPIGLDDGTIARKYGGVRTLPTTFVIGPEGHIRKRIPGMTTEAMLRPILEALLDETS